MMLLNASETAKNSINDSFQQGEEKEFLIANAPFMICYLVMIVIGLIGNLLVITVVKKNPHMRSTTNVLLAFLAVSDLISVVCFIPFAFLLAFRLPGGTLGAVLCLVFKTANLASVTVVVSITTLAILATERYHALLKPMRDGLRLNNSNVYYCICGISVYAFALIGPFFVFTKYDERQRKCFSNFGPNGRRIYFSVFGVGVFLALVVICFCYCRIIKAFYFGNNKVCVNEDERHKRKVVKLLLLINVAFIICFTPRAVYFLFYHSNRGLFHQISFFMLHCNSAINPIILGFQSKNYRTEFKKELSGLISKMKLHT